MLNIQNQSAMMIVGLERGKYLFVSNLRDIQKVAREVTLGKFVDLLKPPEKTTSFNLRVNGKLSEIIFTTEGEIILRECTKK